MRVLFDPNLEASLRAIGRAADDAGARAWVVGGVVRDALIGAPITDIDVTIAGDAEGVVRRLGVEWNAEFEQHDAFSTATLTAPGTPRVDVVRARRETYAHPGALPDVVPAGIAEDLERRDFSVNAMAADLRADCFGEMLDPMNGKGDLERHTLRILHAGSFADDPTRLFRAGRYAVRLGLEPDAATDEAAALAVRDGALGTISADRRRREVELMLGEPRWADAIAWLNRWGVWEGIAPCWMPCAPMLRRADVVRAWALRSVGEGTSEAADLRWLVLLAATMTPVAEVMAVKPAELRLVHSVWKAIESLSDVDGPAWWRQMDDMPMIALLAATALCGSDSEKARLTGYIASVRNKRLTITGDDLLAHGARPGPALGLALSLTLDGLRTGRLNGAEAELKYAMNAWRENAGAGGQS
ncbi:MAG TPA: hypothetical protein VGM51_14995 [Armatimonadota bacterium]|jgi:tRNA nucleotidyltransferase (CCA-adding enzyme)